MDIVGHMDRCDAALVEGWVYSPDEMNRRFVLQVFAGTALLGETVADRFRQDLLDAGFGDGHCAFSFALPAQLGASARRDMRLRITGSSVYLLAEADTILGAAAEADAPAESARGTVSRFGGLWIDRTDWIDRLAEKHRRGEFSDDLTLAIFRFVRDGALIIRNAVLPATVNALNAAIERIWAVPPEGLVMETFEPDGVQRFIPPDLQYRDGRTKLLDLYAYSEAARRAIAAPNVIAFLAAIFDDTPKAFQGLTFWNGSQQPMRKDTAAVRVEPDPLQFAATWLALEDVRPGSGEPEYYIGSHRAPDFLFGGVSKWMEDFTADQERFLLSLHQDADSYGHVKASFLAKKGDVLIRHADLAHGEAAVTQPKFSRRSMLTHFMPARQEPHYRRGLKRQALDAGTCVFVSHFADVG
jgi:phytanoyl-CoA hydroxylase